MHDNKGFLLLTRVLFVGMFVLMGGCSRLTAARTLAPVSIYTDGLAAGWQDWSWGITRDLNNSNPVFDGTNSIAASYDAAWSGLYLHLDSGLSTKGYTDLVFYVHGGPQGGQKLNVVANKDTNAVYEVDPQANAWLRVVIPLKNLGEPAEVWDLIFQDSKGAPQPTFYLDDIRLENVSEEAAAQASVPAPMAADSTAAQVQPGESTGQPGQSGQPTQATATSDGAAAAVTADAPTAEPVSLDGPSVEIYIDGLAADWQNWSWDTTANLESGAPVQDGSKAMMATFDQAWGALYLHNDSGLATRGYVYLSFWVNGGPQGGQKIRLNINKSTTNVYDFTAPANQWQQVLVPLTSLGAPAIISELFWQDASGGPQAAFSIDTVALMGYREPEVVDGPALSVDTGADQHAISADIYGMNFAEEALAKELRLPVNRYGGNGTTRYNWQNDTSNRASDWFFENIANDNSGGSAVDGFIAQNQRTGAQSIITMPLIGWTPKSREATCGFSVSKYGPQQWTDSYRPDCGNGVREDGSPISNNDPHDTSVEIGPAFDQTWVEHLVSQYGDAASGGVRFYSLDNEPMLWNSTHRDVHPDPVSYDELRDRSYQYGAAIKAGDPTAMTLGPALWGWSAYSFSAKDTEAGGSWWQSPADRNAHGGTPLVEWYLQQMQAYEAQHGLRILDYLDLHYYPQAQNVALSDNLDAATQELRLRSTRSLWDAGYSDELWIGEPVRLIPRMREWVDKYYPGTKLALSEYNWGGLSHMNGALAQADVLGIFGREGLDLATLWDPPASAEPGAFAFRMYRNYDGQGGAFGETSVRASSADQDKLAVYAATRAADGALTIVVINKTGADLRTTLSLANVAAGATAEVYRYGQEDLSQIVRQDDLTLAEGSLSAIFPANSITTLVVP